MRAMKGWAGFFLLALVLCSSASIAQAHQEFTGATPSVGTCGTSPSVVGGDNSGTITIGSGVVTACTLTFAKTWAGTPACVATSGSGSISAGVTAISTTAVTFGLSATLGDGKIYYFCARSQ